MVRTKRQQQASKQAPWRLHILMTSRTALWLIGLLVLGGIYLAVNAKVAKAGREVLVQEARREDLQREKAELTATLAELSAPEYMLERAAYLGFRPAEPHEVDYFEVSGYDPLPSFEAPLPPGTTEIGESMLSPAYTETLGDWFSRWLSGGN